MEKLCRFCKASGECYFKAETTRVINLIDTDLIDDRKKIEAIVVRSIIARERKEAEDKSCPHKGWDPDYPGKELL